MNLSQIDQITSEPEPFNFILADLGVSSMQIDKPHSAVIARAILSSIKKGIDISTTTQLRNIIKDDEIKKSCQRTFQALRIDVNSRARSANYALQSKHKL